MQTFKWILGVSGGTLAYIAACSENLTQICTLGGIGIGLLLAAAVVRSMQASRANRHTDKPPRHHR